MAYSGPTAVATLDLLIQAIVNFAVANAGFANEGSITAPTGQGYTTSMYRISKGGFYWFFVGGTETINSATAGFIAYRVMNVLPTAVNYNNTTYGPQYVDKWGLYYNYNGPYTAYNLFTDGTAVHCALETYPNVFTHLSFGSITKLGTWTGGEYATANYWHSWSTTAPIGWAINRSGLFCCQYGGGSNLSGGYIRFGNSYSGDYRDWAFFSIAVVNSQKAIGSVICNVDSTTTAWQYYPNGALFWAGPNAFNARTPLLPMHVWLYHAATSSMFLAGSVPGAAVVNINLLQPKDIIEVDWEVFPLAQKSGNRAVAPPTDRCGVAFRRIP